MEPAEAAGHAVAVSVLMLIGVPVNAAIIWIHTRSTSHLTHNKFPIIFATIDVVVLTSLPIAPIAGRGAELSSPVTVALSYFYDVLFGWMVHAYCSTLLLASVDKLYAVTYPFAYRRKHDVIVRIAITWVTVIDVSLSVIASSPLVNDVMPAVVYFYTVYFLLTFLATILLYVVIVVRITQSERSTWRKIQPKTGT